MKACVDREKCIGCGLCASICPEVFELDGENISTVKVEIVPAEVEEQVKEAADSCPVEAISWE